MGATILKNIIISAHIHSVAYNSAISNAHIKRLHSHYDNLHWVLWKVW